MSSDFQSYTETDSHSQDFHDRICLCLTGSTLKEWTAQQNRNRAWIQYIELRVDMLAPAERKGVAEWVQKHALYPAILTIRRKDDYGKWGDNADETEQNRCLLMQSIVRECGSVGRGVGKTVAPAYVDIELDNEWSRNWQTITQDVIKSGGNIIFSLHKEARSIQNSSVVSHNAAAYTGFWDTVIQNASERVSPAVNTKVIIKAALFLQGDDDITTVIQLRESWKIYTAARRFDNHFCLLLIGMGDFGIVSRVLPVHFHSEWTYASDAQGVSAAAGQLSPKILAERYSVNTVHKADKVFAIVGNPVAHSQSPEYHNRLFRTKNIRAVYAPLLLRSFTQFKYIAQMLPISGASVTVPHKTAAMQFVRAEHKNGVRNAAQVTGAANTLIRDTHGRWYADNTDVEGFTVPLVRVLRQKSNHTVHNTAQKQAFFAAVIGAGGAARAVIAALCGDVVTAALQQKCIIHIFNRTPSRADVLARDFCIPAERVHRLKQGSEFSPCFSEEIVPMKQQRERFSLIVQTTTVGMNNHEDPIPQYMFHGDEIVYDVIYTPPKTKMLRRAEARGCRIITGIHMFHAQAEAQHRIFSEYVYNKE